LLSPAPHHPLSRTARAPAPVPAFNRACGLVEAVVAATFGVPLAALHASSRGAREIAFARHTAIYLAHVVLGMSCGAIGRTFGRDRTTVAYACRVIEERREDPATDALLRMLEELCRDVMDRARLAPPVRP
jgi:hypothetical protein